MTRKIKDTKNYGQNLEQNGMSVSASRATGVVTH